LQGICVWFTGLPCAGKSTIAKLVTENLTQSGQTVTLLDADVIRPILCPDLGYSREDRRKNVLRVAYVARQIVLHGGTVVVATISPFEADRKLVRAHFEPGAFLQAYVNAPLGVCESRDVKGMYAKARSGEITHFTGLSSPYEEPGDSELICDTSRLSAVECAQTVVRAIAARRPCLTIS